MRIKIKKGKQKELIVSVKQTRAWTWKTLAKELEVSEGYLKNELAKEKRTLSEKIFKKLNALSNKKYSSQIEAKLSDNWGRRKGGEKGKGKRLQIIPIKTKKNPSLAEVMGIILGDGSLYYSEKFAAYQLRISGHKFDDEAYFLKIVKPLFEKVFLVKFYIKKSKKRKSIWLCVQRKDVFVTVESLGFPHGNKKKNRVRIPFWIRKNKKLMRACIRGIFDTDGSVYPKSKNHKFSALWIKSGIPSLLEDIVHALRTLGYSPHVWKGNGTPYACIYKKEDVFRFAREVGFNNQKHQKNFVKFAPVV